MKINKMAKKIEFWEITKLKPYANNPRIHSPEQIQKIMNSIKEFGFNNPILVDKKKGIIAGHGRIEAAKKLEIKKVPVVVLDHLTPKQRKAYVIADNRLALDATWDEDLLAKEMADLKTDGFDLETAGFSDSEVEQVLIEGIEEKTEKIKSFKKTHILLSFPAEKFDKIVVHIEKILKIDGVEYDQSSN